MMIENIYTLKFSFNRGPVMTSFMTEVSSQKTSEELSFVLHGTTAKAENSRKTLCVNKLPK